MMDIYRQQLGRNGVTQLKFLGFVNRWRNHRGTGTYLRSAFQLVILCQVIGLLHCHVRVEVFWVMTPSTVVVGYQCFGGSCCLHVNFTLKTEATQPSETLVTYNIATLCHKPEDHGFNLHRRGNLKSRNVYLDFLNAVARLHDFNIGRRPLANRQNFMSLHVILLQTISLF
jgi:hypothetical protein